MNPVKHFSEFAGVTFEEQCDMIGKAVRIFSSHALKPQVFFAPAHTFDENTLKALESCSDIRIVSDTIAADVYEYHGFIFIPQQTGKARKLPFRTVTMCYHPNIMEEQHFVQLDAFLQKYFGSFGTLQTCMNGKHYREKSLYDKFLSWLYFKK